MTTTDERGYICSQNVAAMAAFGCHVPCATTRADGTDQGHNFLEMLFHGHPVRPVLNYHKNEVNLHNKCSSLLQ